MEGATCIVEEEFQEEFLHMDSNVSTRDNDDKIGDEAKAFKLVDIGTAQEDHLVLAPPPLTAIPEVFLAPPPLFNPE